jgi:hypothetical protein
MPDLAVGRVGFRPLDAGSATPRHEPPWRRCGAPGAFAGISVLAMVLQVREAAAQLYRLRLITADPLSLRNRTVCDLPCKTTLITPEIPYSLL